MMLDCTGTEIKIGDTVVFPVNISADMYRLRFATVVGFTNENVLIKCVYDVHFSNKTRIKPKKLLVINPEQAVLKANAKAY